MAVKINETTGAPTTVTIGAGTSVHYGHYSGQDDTLWGSLCNAWVTSTGKRVYTTSAPATCAKCVKQYAEGTARAV